MNVEFTGRHYEITPTIRKSVETGLTKIRKILGDKFDSARTQMGIAVHGGKSRLADCADAGTRRTLACRVECQLGRLCYFTSNQ